MANKRKNRRPRTEAPPVRMVAQSHGGALREGGTNKGGLGRMPSLIRQRAAASYDERMGVLEEIADGKVTTTIRARCEKCGHEPESVPDLPSVLRAVPMPGDRIRA